MKSPTVTPRWLVAGTLLLVADLAAEDRGWAPHLYVVTSDSMGATSDALALVAPWTAVQNVEPVAREATVRHFFGLHYVVSRIDGTVQVVNPGTFETLHTFSVGARSEPHDICVVAPDKAYVSRQASPLLYEVDPRTGALTDTMDLSLLADDDGLPDMSMLALDGNHLFVQLQRVDGTSGIPRHPSYLAVVDVRTNELVDADPGAPGVQGVALHGTIPSFRMQIDHAARRLYVSTPALPFDVSGGIEEVDLDTLQSLGFVLPEERWSIDLGGFVMLSADEGYVIGHTDIIAAAHLMRFHRDPDEPGQGPVFDSLFHSHDVLAHDAGTQQLFFPDPTASPMPGIRVFDAITDARLTPTAVATSKPPVDLVVARQVTPGEAALLGIARDATASAMTITYAPACGATNHNLVFGPLEEVATYSYTGQACAIGAGAPFSGFSPGAGSFFFLVVGTDGAAREGSYGRASSGAERPEVLDDPACAYDQDLTARCD
jgi:hypothetical protein